MKELKWIIINIIIIIYFVGLVHPYIAENLAGIDTGRNYD